MYSEFKWKIWLLSNFEVCEGSLIETKKVHKKALSVKENITNRNAATSLGLVVKHLWGDKVRLITKGPRKNQTRFYLNLEEKKQKIDHPFTECIPQPKGWVSINNGPQDISYLRYENWEFNGQRVTTELRVNHPIPGQTKFTLSSRGVHCDLNNLLGLNEIWSNDLSTPDQIHIILEFMNVSELCLGMEIDGVGTQTQLPHDVGIVKSNESDQTSKAEQRAFSQKCQIISVNKCCKSCQRLKMIIKQGNKRRSHYDQVPHPKTNKRYLTKEKVIQQIDEERKQRKNAEKREKYWRKEFEKQCLLMSDEDHHDLETIFKSCKDIPDDMTCLWEQQQSILQCKSPNGYRWHPKIMRLCLDLYCKNPHVLDPLREFLILPSNKTIRLYKNKINESPGWNHDALSWCSKAAKDNNLKPSDYYGGFVIDEMKIQENLEMTNVGGKQKLVGFVNLGKGHDVMRNLSEVPGDNN